MKLYALCIQLSSNQTIIPSILFTSDTKALDHIPEVKRLMMEKAKLSLRELDACILSIDVAEFKEIQ